MAASSRTGRFELFHFLAVSEIYWSNSVCPNKPDANRQSVHQTSNRGELTDREKLMEDLMKGMLDFLSMEARLVCALLH